MSVVLVPQSAEQWSVLDLLVDAPEPVNPVNKQRLERQPCPEHCRRHLAEIDVIDRHIDIGWENDDEKKYEEI